MPTVFHPIGMLARTIYERAVRRRNSQFDRGERFVQRLDLPVISIGNISVGGTGKTPMVQWTARRLRDQAFHPFIAMRGYKAKQGRKSDEQIEHEQRLVDVPVIANPERAQAIESFLKKRSGEYDCCLLDDGFQHRQLARDLDIVLIDATRSPFDDRLLPLGWLREPVQNLARADAVVLTRADLRDESRLDRLHFQITKHHGKPPVAQFRHVWSKMMVAGPGADAGGQLTTESVGSLARKRVLVLCGIAHPESFIEQVELHGATIGERVIQPDHAEYSSKTIRSICSRAAKARCDAMVTTNKDWVKIAEHLGGVSLEMPIMVPLLDVEPIEGGSVLERLMLETIRQPGPIAASSTTTTVKPEPIEPNLRVDSAVQR